MAARAERDRVRRENEARPDTHDYSEAQTRDLYIDLLLKEAGWPLNEARDREYPVEGMPNTEGRASSIMCCGATTVCPWR